MATRQWAPVVAATGAAAALVAVLVVAGAGTLSADVLVADHAAAALPRLSLPNSCQNWLMTHTFPTCADPGLALG